jgi:glycosyltransferase involved in cell wall biosynthesis
MKLLLISDAPILIEKKEKVAYAPYVKEMDLWMKHACSTTYVCPTRYDRSLLTKAFDYQHFQIKSVKRLEFHRIRSILISSLSIPYQAIVLWNAMRKADHIHLRCPGNLALLASLIQVTLPRKRKTVKYAGNFDPLASQPLAYRWQKRILSNTFLSKNIAVLVYGDWPDQTKNIKPFFTATYKKEQIEPAVERDWNAPLKAIFVGTMGANKRPLEVFEIIKELVEKGIDISLDFYGDGPLKKEIASKVKKAALEKRILLHGNVDQSILTEAYKKAHFSFLLSKSEGWPKAVAEAMFWGCIPVATEVSCVAWMLGKINLEFSDYGSEAELKKRMAASSAATSQIPNSKSQEDGSSNECQEPLNMEVGTAELALRGILVKDIPKAASMVEEYLKQPALLHEMSQKAAKWSQHYTLDDFENEIVFLLKTTGDSKARTK